jgi:hypothetical protein
MRAAGDHQRGSAARVDLLKAPFAVLDVARVEIS